MPCVTVLAVLVPCCCGAGGGQVKGRRRFGGSRARGMLACAPRMSFFCAVAIRGYQYTAELCVSLLPCDADERTARRVDGGAEAADRGACVRFRDVSTSVLTRVVFVPKVVQKMKRNSNDHKTREVVLEELTALPENTPTYLSVGTFGLRSWCVCVGGVRPLPHRQLCRQDVLARSQDSCNCHSEEGRSHLCRTRCNSEGLFLSPRVLRVCWSPPIPCCGTNVVGRKRRSILRRSFLPTPRRSKRLKSSLRRQDTLHDDDRRGCVRAGVTNVHRTHFVHALEK